MSAPRPRLRGFAALLLAALIPMPAAAAPLRAVRIVGVDGDLEANVEATLSLTRLPARLRRDLGEARLAYLLRRAPEEVERALQPYGYYDSRTTSDVARDARGISVTLTIDPGAPVRVAEQAIAVDGDAADDPRVARSVRAFAPRTGARLDHRLYEASKLSVQRRLLERGYFDAELVEHRIEVRRLAREAVLRVRWKSGRRHRFGRVVFEGAQVDAALLRQSVPFAAGEPFDQSHLLALHRRLTDLDYFGYIDVRPDVEAAEDGEVPIAVSVAPGKRSIYTAGISYGTDAGGGVQLGLERRWVNRRGHKFGAQLDYAQRRKSLALVYRIPAFDWAEGWYAFGVNRREEDSESVSTRISEFVAQRTGQRWGWTLGAAFHVRQERFQLGDERIVQRGDTRLVYPALSAERKQGDDPLYPRRGHLLRGEVRVGSGAIGSQADFAQLLLDAKWIRGLGANSRLLLRAQAGRTATDEFDELPPSLRFYAGGDRSLRGYGFQEIGPRLDGEVIGGKHLLTASAELEQMFSERWGAALFVDAGDAYSARDAFRLRTGVGIGLRWRSPVGLVRVDVAHGLRDADNSLQLHVNIGPDL